MLRDAGFAEPSIEPTRVYDRDDAIALLTGTGLDLSLANDVAGKIMSGFVRATKPGPKPATQPAAKGKRSCGCDDGCCN
jgi:hypothetical protein